MSLDVKALKTKDIKDFMNGADVISDIHARNQNTYKVLENLELYYGDLDELKRSSQEVKSEEKPFIADKIILIVILIFSFAESLIFSFFLPNGTRIVPAIFSFSLIFGWMTLFNIIFFVPNSKGLFLKVIKKLWIDAVYINIDSKLNYIYQLKPNLAQKELDNEQEQEPYTINLQTIK